MWDGGDAVPRDAGGKGCGTQRYHQLLVDLRFPPVMDAISLSPLGDPCLG